MNFAIILAAGKGARSKVSNKVLTEINGKPMLWHALSVFYAHPQINQFALVIRESDKEKIQQWLDEWRMDVMLVTGGESRQESVQKGAEALPVNPEDFLIIHNAANPFVTANEITQVIESAEQVGAACVAHRATDTIKKVENKSIKRTLNRSQIWQAQTPQVIRADLYQKALAKLCRFNATLPNITDEMMLAEEIGIRPIVVLASENNFKITTKRDLEFAKFLLESNPETNITPNSTTSPIEATSSPEIRTGIGLDSHRFHRKHKGLTLGGLHLKNEPQTIANSDGDVVIHALCNAILQALGQGSLGTIADSMCEQGITDSREYLKCVIKFMNEQNFSLQQVGFQLEGATPKIDPIADELKHNLGQLLQLDPAQIGITATTGEDLTPFGRGEGLQCFATATLKKV